MLFLSLVTIVSCETLWFAHFNLEYFKIEMEIDNTSKLITMVGNNSSLELKLQDDYFRLTLSQLGNFELHSVRINNSDSNTLVFVRKNSLFQLNGRNYTKIFSEGEIEYLNLTRFAAYSHVLSFANKQCDDLMVTRCISSCDTFTPEYLYGLIAVPIILIALSTYKRIKKKVDRELNEVLETLDAS